MHVYFCINGFPVILPYEALQALGEPRHISFAYDLGKNTLLIFPLKRPKPDRDIGYATIPDRVYREQAAFAVYAHHDFKELMLFLSDTSGLNSYIAPASIIAAGTSAPEKQDLNKMLSGKPVLFIQMTDTETFQEAGIPDYPEDVSRIYTTGADRVR